MLAGFGKPHHLLSRGNEIPSSDEAKLASMDTGVGRYATESCYFFIVRLVFKFKYRE